MAQQRAGRSGRLRSLIAPVLVTATLMLAGSPASAARLPGEPVVHLFQRPGIASPTGVAVSDGGTVWFIDSNSHQPGLGRLRGPRDAVDFFPTSPTPLSGRLVVGPDRRPWFFTLDGITTFDPATGQVTVVGQQGDCLVDGPDGGVWFIRGSDHTVGRIDPTTDAVTLYSYASIPGLSTGVVCLASVLGPQQHLWFTEEDHNGFTDMVDFDPATHSSSAFPTGALLSHGLAYGADGGLWFGLDGQFTLQRFDPTTHLITPFVLPGWNDPGASVLITSVAPDANGTLWVTITGMRPSAPYGSSAVANFDPTTGVFTLGRLRSQGASSGKDPGDDVGSIVRGPKGAYWFADSYAGVLPNGALGRVVPAH
jgi:streptogramin lyase